MLGLLLQYQRNKFQRYFASRISAKLVTAFLFFVVLLLVATGVYLFFREGFTYISFDKYFQRALSLYIYENFFLIIVWLVVFSSIITGFFQLFQGQHDNWIMSTANFKVFPLYVFINNIFSSLWPLIIIVLPALFAIRAVFGLSILGLFLIIILVALLIIMTVGFVFVCIMFVGYLGLALGKLFHLQFKSKYLIFILILLLVLEIGFTWQIVLDTDLIQLFKAKNLELQAADTSLIAEHYSLLPTHQVAQSLLAWQEHNNIEMIFRFFVIIAITIFSLVLLKAVSRWFLSLWQVFQEGDASTESKQLANKCQKLNGLRFTGGPVMALFKKEAIISYRNTKNVMWFSFLVLVWVLQAGLNVIISRNIASYSLDLDSLPVIAQALQFVTAIYFVSAFALRFAFPSFSSERKTAWIIASAPLDLSKVFWAKYTFYTSIFCVLGVVVSYINFMILSLPLSLTLLSLGLMTIMVVFVVTLGICLGAIYPNFETDDPSILSTTLPGLAFIFGSLIYGSVGAGAFYWSLSFGSTVAILLFGLLSLLITVLLLYNTIKSFSKIEFIKTYNKYE